MASSVIATIDLKNLKEVQDYIEELRAALPDPDKLETLANWLDLYDVRHIYKHGHDEIQNDLRKWAQLARDAIER